MLGKNRRDISELEIGGRICLLRVLSDFRLSKVISIHEQSLKVNTEKTKKKRKEKERDRDQEEIHTAGGLIAERPRGGRRTVEVDRVVVEAALGGEKDVGKSATVRIWSGRSSERRRGSSGRGLALGGEEDVGDGEDLVGAVVGELGSWDRRRAVEGCARD
ncbi:uncharacterized protein A4U43_C03F24600 [Asparagus officinalis]|uniref:Uncharacterized protein n=1 Tax=Asparagus officinalis TaxID=4686 RepID=A0A5P1FEK2_ASPOF|nr:uncharacterized protein A4U43_C03F24600 [Asparagus officinalis]